MVAERASIDGRNLFQIEHLEPAPRNADNRKLTRNFKFGQKPTKAVM
jgi:hypothetical protein